MVKANELRVGNWVNILKTVPVLITGNHIQSISEGDADYKPIPLTPEILEKCGFRKYKDDSGGKVFKSFRYNNLCIEYRTKKSRGMIVWHDSNDDYGITLPSISIISLHQLQNLYYALTGEELIYTP